jgi:transposase
MHNLLQWPNWTIVDVAEDQRDIHITAHPNNSPELCLHCGTTGELQQFGKRDHLYLDIPIRGKRVGIHVPRQRWRCKACRRTFYEAIEEMHPIHRMTKRLVTYIEQQSLPKPFVTLADEVGVNETTIRNIFRAYAKRLENETTFVTPAVLGIDELHLLGKPRCILANVEHATLVDILKTRSKAAVSARLRQFANRERIEVVTMDMWRPYYDAVREVLPGATVIIDKFHVVRLVNQAVETIRKELRASLSDRQRRGLMHDRFVLLKRRHDLDERERLLLETWTGMYPRLQQAYEAKESFYDLWTSASSPQEAQERYEEWRRKLHADVATAFSDLTTAITNWQEPVFAYFEYGDLTNAYTEALNGLIKEAVRRGRGYSFEVVRAKALYSNGFHRHKRPGYERRPALREPEMAQCTLPFQSPHQPDKDQQTGNLGAAIQSIAAHLGYILIWDDPIKKSE